MRRDRSRRLARAAGRYRVALWLLPAGFRALHGKEMLRDFARLAAAAERERGLVGLVGVQARAIVDVLLRAPAERCRDSLIQRVWNGTVTGAGGRRRGGVEMLQDVVQSIRVAIRALSRRPGFTLVALLTLALGIGANVAIFTVVNSVLLQPLPYPGSDDIVLVRHHLPGLNLPELENSAGMINMYREQATKITRMAAVDQTRRNLSGIDRPDRVQVVQVTPEFFDVVATRPVLGRPIAEEDVAQAAAPVAILTYPAWQTRFGGDMGVIGRVVEFDGERTEIVGVMPRGFEYPDPETAVLLPLKLDPELAFGTFGLGGLARLQPGVSLEEARNELEGLQSRLPEQFPGLTQEFLDGGGWSVSIHLLRDFLVRDIRSALWILLGTVGLVLLIAGANVANLFLVRAESRQREVAVRSALGANRRRLAGPFLAESVVLGLAGGILGTVLAWAGVRLLVATGPEQLPRLHEVGFDANVVGFALLLSIGAGLILGLFPLLHLAGRHVTALLRSGAQHATAGRERHRLRRLLIVGQVAMALVLLVSSGLMVRSMVRLRNVDPGVRTADVLTVGVSLGRSDDRAASVAFYDRVLERLQGLPGIERVSMTNSLPIAVGSLNGSSFNIESRPREEDELPPVAMYTAVMEEYFAALDMPLLEGRSPDRSDYRANPPAVWVNETFKRQFLPDGALGERLQFGQDSTWMEVAGVVGDVRTFGVREEIRPMAYMPMTGAAAAELSVMYIVAQAASNPMGLLPGIRAAVGELDGSVPLTTVRTMEEIVAESLADTSFTLALLTIAALVALLLGVVGLYGVISYIVSQRTHEIGVRVALGARPRTVRSLVVRQGAGVTLVGIALGLAGAVAATRLLASLLFEVSARDPFTFVVTALILAAVSMLATWLPARRAAAISPLEAIREE